MCTDKCVVFWRDSISYIVYLHSPLVCEAWQLSPQITLRQLMQTPDRCVPVRRKDRKSSHGNETSVCLFPISALIHDLLFENLLPVSSVSLLAIDFLRLFDMLSTQVFYYLSKQLPVGEGNFCWSAEPFVIAFLQTLMEMIICIG